MNICLRSKIGFFWVLLLLAITCGGMISPTSVSAQTSSVIALATGDTFSLALRSDGTVLAWGWNRYGQLGNGNTSEISSNEPAPVRGLTGVKAVAAGSDFGMALKNDGTVWAWGDNHYGQLGNGGNTDSTVPVRVNGLSGVIAIAVGSIHSMALRADGTVWVWGNNTYGQLGDDDLDSYEPIQIANLTGMVAIAAGCNHNLALKRDGTVWSWGWNFTGQLGHSYREDAEFDEFAPPKQVAGIEGVVAVSAGGSHSLAIKKDGTVWSWGNNGFGQLGYQTNGIVSAFPNRIAGLGNIVAIAAGDEQSAALKSDGTVLVWGSNREGQLANNSSKESCLPLPVNGLSGVTAIAFRGHVLVLKADGTVWGWGDNQFGQAGGTGDAIFQPVQVNGL